MNENREPMLLGGTEPILLTHTRPEPRQVEFPAQQTTTMTVVGLPSIDALPAQYLRRAQVDDSLPPIRHDRQKTATHAGVALLISIGTFVIVATVVIITTAVEKPPFMPFRLSPDSLVVPPAPVKVIDDESGDADTVGVIVLPRDRGDVRLQSPEPVVRTTEAPLVRAVPVPSATRQQMTPVTAPLETTTTTVTTTVEETAPVETTTPETTTPETSVSESVTPTD